MSTDGGAVWEQKDSYYDDGGCCIVHPDSAHIILTGGKGPITQTNWSFVVSRSRNSGATWTRHVLSGTASGYCYSLAVAPSERSIIYAGGEVSNAGAVYRSTDFGATWNRTAGSPGGTVQSLAVHPLDPDRVLAATGAGIFLTTNGGTSWTVLTGTSGSRSVVFYPGGEDTVVTGGDFGVMISRDRGASWTSMNSGLEGRSVTLVGFAERGGPFLVAGTTNSACFGWQFVTGLAQSGTEIAPTPAIGPGIVRNVLLLDASGEGREAKGVLLDISGRRVLTLASGENDVSRLGPGVYFVRLTLARGQERCTRIVRIR